MKSKRIIALALCMILIFSVPAFAKTVEFTVGSNDLYVSDIGIQKIAFDASPYIENGRTFVPVKAVADAFGADALWDGEARKVTFSTEETVIELTIDSSVALVNGVQKTLDAPCTIKDGRTFVPLRFISEALKKSVEFVAPSSQILITDENVVMTIDGYPVTMDDYRFLFLYYNLVDSYYTPEVIVPILTDAFISNISVLNEAKKNGFTLHASQTQELKDSILSSSNLFYPLTLTAPGVKTITDIFYASQYYDTLFSTGNIDEETITDYYLNNYVCAKHILISTIDENGKPFNKNKMKSAKATADAVYRLAKKGEDFDALIEKYGEDPGAEYNPDGYIFTKGEMVEEFEKASFSLGTGKISQPVKSPY